MIIECIKADLSTGLQANTLRAVMSAIRIPGRYLIPLALLLPGGVVEQGGEAVVLASKVLLRNN